MDPWRSWDCLRLERQELLKSPQYSIESKILEVSQVLTNYYAVQLTRNEKVVGIVTKADIFKLLNMHTSSNA